MGTRYTLLIDYALALSLVVCASQALAAPQGPSPTLSAVDVVRTQLAALRQGDTRRAYRFASPDNRAAVGSASDFAHMLQQRYGDMLTQSGAEVTLEQQSEAGAHVLAELHQPGGATSAYIFFLSREQTDDCDGCWMTEGVAPVKPKNAEPRYSI